jgi:hypothetical protein
VAVGEVITATQMNGLPVRIADVTLSASAANIDFQSIPSQFAHLIVECYLRGDTAATSVSVVLRFNNDTAANYDFQLLTGVGATAGAAEVFADVGIRVGTAPANTAGANLFNALTIEAPHYANSANNKATSSAYGYKVGTATSNILVGASAGFWRSSAAITRVTVFPSAGNFVSGSRVTLYGLP